MFLQTSARLGVKNGTLGTLQDFAGPSARPCASSGCQRPCRWSLRPADYAHVDHGYAATIHKAQGVTVDRAYVQATRRSWTGMPPMWPHPASGRAWTCIGRGRTSRDRAGLDRVLSRERAKDTTLDYQTGFAERRGIIPHSEIIVERAPARESLRRSMFAGLKLGEGADRRPAQVQGTARDGQSAFGAAARPGGAAHP